MRSFDLLGQRQYTPGSPAGWPDTVEKLGRVRCAHAPRAVGIAGGDRYESGLEPVELAASSLGAYARPETLTALRRAASASQALALLLMSPEFQRR